jgi:hypothetical protein
VKTIIVHVASFRMLDANITYRNGNEQERAGVENDKSSELHFVTEALLRNGWDVYWSLLDDIDIDELHYRSLYNVRTGSTVDMDRGRLNNEIDMILVRIIGSVEGKLATVKRYFEQLRDMYDGVTVNDPSSAIYGLRKDYLFELINAGFRTIPTDYYERSVTFAELEAKYGDRMNQHIVKPVTGELSNSLRVLNETNEEFFRYKEPLVGGWLVQPVMAEIWHGEYQLFFLGDSCTHGNKKLYERSDAHPIIPSQANRLIEEYRPAESELELALRLRQFYADRLGLNTDIFRLDFMKDDAGQPIVVEFETVNPGFFIKYISEPRKHKIAEDFEAFLSRRLQQANPK